MATDIRLSTDEMLDQLLDERLVRDAIFMSDMPASTYVARMASGRFVCTTAAPYDMRTYDTFEGLRARLDSLFPDGMCWLHKPITAGLGQPA